MQRIIGLELDGSTVTLTIGRTTIPAMAAKYGDNLSTEYLRFMGEQSIAAMTPGTYEVEDGEIKLSASVLRGDLVPLMDQYGFGNRRINVVISRTHPDLGTDSDLLHDCRFIGLAAAVENSNKAEETPIKIRYRQIYWSDLRITVNALDTSMPLGDSML